MAKYLKNKEEILNDIRAIAKDLTINDLVSIMNIQKERLFDNKLGIKSIVKLNVS